MSKYGVMGLYPHNVENYKKVIEALKKEKISSIVHATGTGKSYIALELAYKYRDKQVVYVVPSNGIIEHLKEIIKENNMELERDFPNLHFRTYQSFVNLSREEIASIPCDMLVLDEFHHLGAPVWGARINTFIEAHDNLKIFGMTAYTVRDRGTIYERDMTNPLGSELFSNTVVSRYDLCDAMIDGVIPKPIYKTAYVNLINMANYIEEKLENIDKVSEEYQEYSTILRDAKRRIAEAPSIKELLERNLKKNGKYIYFCPAISREGSSDIETVKSEILSYLKDFISESDIEVYTTTSEMGIVGKQNRDAFYKNVDLDGKDVSNKLRIMFAINQYNEGVHAPNIDGVIMGRATSSDIVYFEQLGRALSVRGNTKEEYDRLDKYSLEELIIMCKERNIDIKENVTKEEIIEKLIAPIIIDLTNNIEFIKELENNLGTRIREIREKREAEKEREIKVTDATFDIDVMNIELYEILSKLRDRLIKSWDDYYELAKAYYEHHGDLKMPYDFKTLNGYEYDEKGVELGSWICTKRKESKNGNLPDDKVEKLKEIGMIWNIQEHSWNKYYELAEAYFKHHGNLNISKDFKTINGYEYDEKGIKLGNWINYQRQVYNDSKLLSERKDKLEEIGMIWNILEDSWNKYYELAEAYFKHHGNLNIPGDFKTINGYEYDENGFNLGNWIGTQRMFYSKGKMLKERKEKLKEIGMIWNISEDSWNKYYELAEAYYKHKGKLKMPNNFKTLNGYEYAKNGLNLDYWMRHQRELYKKGKLLKVQIDKLEIIGMIWDPLEDSWNECYELAKTYYKHKGNLKIPFVFKTLNGYEYAENGINLGTWISGQRKAYSKNILLKERKDKLEKIGMIWDIKTNTELIKNICQEYNINYIKNKTILSHISIQELISKINYLVHINSSIATNNGMLVDIFSISNEDMKEKYNITLEELINDYYHSKERGM